MIGAGVIWVPACGLQRRGETGLPDTFVKGGCPLICALVPRPSLQNGDDTEACRITCCIRANASKPCESELGR